MKDEFRKIKLRIQFCFPVLRETGMEKCLQQYWKTFSTYLGNICSLFKIQINGSLCI